MKIRALLVASFAAGLVLLPSVVAAQTLSLGLKTQVQVQPALIPTPPEAFRRATALAVGAVVEVDLPGKIGLEVSGIRYSTDSSENRIVGLDRIQDARTVGD